MYRTKSEILHNAARRFCIDHSNAIEELIWQVREYVPQTDSFSAAMLIQTAILEEVEKAILDHWRSESAMRKFLLACGHKAHVYLSSRLSWRNKKPYLEHDEPQWTAEELRGLEGARHDYLEYVRGLTIEHAVEIGPVPYRHILSKHEQQAIGRKLAQRWSVDPLHHYWYPLWKWDEPLPPNVLALQSRHFYREIGSRTLRDILTRRGIARIFELNEVRLDPEYELDPGLTDFRSSGRETYWSSREADWLVYISHEDSITFAGSWLLEEVKKAWPNWEHRIYSGYDYE